MILSVPPTNFEYYFCNERDSIKEIVNLSDTEITYTTYDNQSFTKKIVSKTDVHYFLDGWTTAYTLEDGDKVEIFNYRDFDWRNYPIEEIDKKREATIEKLKKDGIKAPCIKNRYPSLLDCFKDGVSIKDYDKQGNTRTGQINQDSIMSDTKRKYEFTGEICKHNGVKLHRIRALITIPGVIEAGQVGGWIESEKNLSHEGDCWVHGDAKVYGNAMVCDNAKVHGSAQVYGNATVCKNTSVCDNAKVHGNARLRGHAEVYGNARVDDNAYVSNNAKVHAYSMVCGNGIVYGNAEVYGNAMVYGNAEVYGNAKVHGDASVCGAAEVCGDAEVCGNAGVYNYSKVLDGCVTSRYDYITVGPVGSRGDSITLNLNSGTVCTGCFKGSLDNLENAVEITHGDNKHGLAYKGLIAYFRTLVKNKVNEK